MRVTLSSHWLQYKRLLLICAGVIFLVSAAVIAAPRLHNESRIKKIEALPGNAAKLPGSGNTSVAADGYNTDIQPESLPPEQNQAAIPANSADSRCAAILQPLVESYDKAVAADKADLDSRITYPLAGSGLISSYIDAYNQKAVDLHKQYLDEATKADCSFPIKSAQVLPPDYLPAGL